MRSIKIIFNFYVKLFLYLGLSIIFEKNLKPNKMSNFKSEKQKEDTLKSINIEMVQILKTLLAEPRIRVAMKDSGENSILNDNIKKAKLIIEKATK